MHIVSQEKTKEEEGDSGKQPREHGERHQMGFETQSGTRRMSGGGLVSHLIIFCIKR